MKQYHKIENIFNRDTVSNKLIEGEYRQPEVEYLKDLQWIATEKVDGTNIRVIYNNLTEDGSLDGSITFNGKSDNAQLHGHLVIKLQETFLPQLPLFIEKFEGKQVCLYGEGYGAGIQKGECYLDHKDFILFDVWIDGVWLSRGDVEGIALMLGIKTMPIVCIGTLPEMVLIVKSGLQSKWNEHQVFEAEGIVCRPVVELKDKLGNRILIKIKARDFSIKKD